MLPVRLLVHLLERRLERQAFLVCLVLELELFVLVSHRLFY